MVLPKLLKIAEVAEIARAPRSTVLYWIYSGKLKAYKVGRRRLVSEPDLMAFISQRSGDK
jgi:excisionase family DNA binding protein